MKFPLTLIVVFCFLFIRSEAQEDDQITSFTFEETLKYIETTANNFIATPFIELLKDKPDYEPPNCKYSFQVSEIGKLIVDRHCNSKDLSSNDLQWSAYLKRLELSDLDCKEYDVEKSLNYVHLNCARERDYCFVKTRDHHVKVLVQGMAIYVSNKEAASRIHHAFSHLLNMAYRNTDFLTSDPD